MRTVGIFQCEACRNHQSKPVANSGTSGPLGPFSKLVIHHLLERKQRFGELTRLLGGVSARTLTRQLRELEASGIIDREVHQQIPPKVEYSLTPLGRDLTPVLHAMHAWGEKLALIRNRHVRQRKNSGTA